MFFPPVLGRGTLSRPWNSADKDASVTLTNGDLDASSSSAAFGSARAVAALTSGKWYWETKLTAISNILYFITGCMDGSASLGTYIGNTSKSCGLQSGVIGNNYAAGVTGHWAGTPTFALNDVIMHALDRGNGYYWMGQNGTWFNSGDPAAGTGYLFSTLNSGSWYPAVSVHNTGAPTVRMISRHSDFVYPKPVGFQPYGNA